MSETKRGQQSQTTVSTPKLTIAQILARDNQRPVTDSLHIQQRKKAKEDEMKQANERYRKKEKERTNRLRAKMRKEFGFDKMDQMMLDMKSADETDLEMHNWYVRTCNP